nr:MAG TPA: hypothetical protein [Caudoviricetes sp.]
MLMTLRHFKSLKGGNALFFYTLHFRTLKR